MLGAAATFGDSLGLALGDAETLGFSEGEELGPFDLEGTDDDKLG